MKYNASVVRVFVVWIRNGIEISISHILKRYIVLHVGCLHVPALEVHAHVHAYLLSKSGEASCIYISSNNN